MPEYIVILSKKAQKQLDGFSDYIANPILEAIASLQQNPRPPGCKKLKGLEGWRIRIGNYRVIYKINDDILEILVINVDDRKQIYR